MVEEVLQRVGLPVKCSTCAATGYVKPRTDYGGWYKSRLFRKTLKKKWYCPEHAAAGKHTDDYFYQITATPPPSVEASTEEELYKLLD